MEHLGWQTRRVLIIAQDWNARVLIAAQLQQEISCQVVGAANLEDGLERLPLLTSLIIVDWPSMNVAPDRWWGFRAAAARVPVLILARKSDRKELVRLGIETKSILFRPFTVGDVVNRSREMLGEA